jgi:hypothetical protein
MGLRAANPGLSTAIIVKVCLWWTASAGRGVGTVITACCAAGITTFDRYRPLAGQKQLEEGE